VRPLVLALVVLAAAPAAAKSSRDLGHPMDRVWPALVRFLRVDEKLKIVEKDESVHYVLFELVDGKKTFRGAAELQATTDDEGRVATRVWVKIGDRPAYMEMGMLDRFELKVREELGEPPPPPEPPPAPPPEKDKDKKE